MFHPSANRLAGFLEISALSIGLAQSGGWQAKAGMLKIEAFSTKSGGFGRKGVRWREKKKQRWCAVRDSYLVALEEPGEVCKERVSTIGLFTHNSTAQSLGCFPARFRLSNRAPYTLLPTRPEFVSH